MYVCVCVRLFVYFVPPYRTTNGLIAGTGEDDVDGDNDDAQKTMANDETKEEEKKKKKLFT